MHEHACEVMRMQGGDARPLFGGHRSMSQPASALLASAEAVAAGEALVSAMALCHRHCTSARPAAAEALWFRLLQSFCPGAGLARLSHRHDQEPHIHLFCAEDTGEKVGRDVAGRS